LIDSFIKSFNSPTVSTPANPPLTTTYVVKIILKFYKLPFVTEENNKVFNLDKDKLYKDYDCFDKIAILEFSNRIGALITYIMIEAIKPKGLILPISEIPINLKNFIFEFIQGSYKDRIAKDFIRTLLDPFFFLEKFTKLGIVRTGLKINNPDKKNINKILRYLEQEKKNVDKVRNKEVKKVIMRRIMELKKIKELEMNPHDPYWSMYELDNETYIKLNEIYKNTYPKFYAELEKIKNMVLKQNISKVYWLLDTSHVL